MVSETLTQETESNNAFNPYVLMHKIFQAIENPKRGTVLLTVGFGELQDSNTLDALVPLVTHLTGTKWTNAQFNKQIRTLEDLNLVKLVKDPMLGKEEVSYHSLTLLGHLGVFYLYAIHEENVLSLDRAKLEPIFMNQSISNLIRFLSRSVYQKLPVFNRMSKQIHKKSDITKLRGKFLLSWEFPSVFSDTSGLSLKIFEELILDHLSLKTGVSKKTLMEVLGESRITSRLNKLIDQDIVISQKIGKDIYYYLTIKAMYLLVPITLMIYLITNLSNQVFEPKDFFNNFLDEPSEHILIRNSQLFLRNLMLFEDEASS